ncbi:hypothetical protein ACFPM3_20630 [Streptomyces coeruleoprunus]|uniref:Uncharacterized protein n=1 Tax=Streptomyces coeruleoprunus TaxID=285563 RepID=A0ABV9XJ54_9ACTN
MSRIWLVWDRREDEWFSDCPVLFDFDGEQVEINHWKFDDVSLTWNAIDPHRPPRWDGFDLEWRAEPLAGLSGLPGEPLKGVAVFLHREVSFAFEDATVGVYNALDENGLSITATPS